MTQERASEIIALYEDIMGPKCSYCDKEGRSFDIDDENNAIIVKCNHCNLKLTLTDVKR